MSNFKHDSYCGLYCGACDIMALFKKSLNDGRERNWNDLPPEFQKNLPWDRKSEIKCFGCKTDTVFAGCAVCFIRKCAKEKNISVCVECEVYPCIKHEQQGFHRPEIHEILPHIKSYLKNSIIIREKGINKWLSTQEEEWKCPDCGTSFTWYAKICGNCGRDVDSLKDYNKSGA